MNIDQIASEDLKLNQDDEAIALAKQRDREIENGLVQPLSHSQLMSNLRNANGMNSKAKAVIVC